MLRRGLIASVMGTCFCLYAGTVAARDPFKINEGSLTYPPEKFSDVQKAADAVTPYLQDVQCGGWNMDQHVAGTISIIDGLPGHLGKWNGAIKSGMGTRLDVNGNNDLSDDFQYPATADGLTTVCKQGQDSIKKSVWRPADDPTKPGLVVKVDIVYPHPKFEDPPCRWRRKSTVPTYSNEAPDIPLKDEYETMPTFEEMPSDTEYRVPPGDRQSPELCTEFCGYLNTWQYYDCLSPGKAKDADGNEYDVCAEWGNKYLCSDQKVSTDPDVVAKLCTPDVADTEWGNSRDCTGSRCRCMQLKQDEDPGVDPKTPDLGCLKNPGNGPKDEKSTYYSYFRQYKASYTRDFITSDHNEDQNAKTDIPVACYGFYNEFDTRTQATFPEDRRCVINIDVSTMKDTQVGKGEFGPSTDTNDPDPLDPANQRPSAGTSGVWFTKLGYGFSLLNERPFEDIYKKDLSSVFLDTNNLDTAKMPASWPVAEKGKAPHLAASDMLRAFDETGTGRVIVSWWQKQQAEISVLLHPQIVRLILPPGYAFGIDPEDPFFAKHKDDVKILTDDRSKSVEIQINAKEDILGEALGYMERSFLLPLKEEPIPVLVPMGSPAEFRAKAEAWCTAYMLDNGVTNCNGAPAAIQDVIQKLESYADQIENVRRLRAELPSYAGKVMLLQKKLTEPISTWIKNNLAAYRQYLLKQEQLKKTVTEKWREAETLMSTFHDKTNLPWCMNQRYETPIYSLLDDWLPLRMDHGRIVADGLPNITAERQSDLTIDFSHIVYMTGALALPVLKPVQVTINVPLPPADLTLLPALPDLPSITPIQSAIDTAISKLPDIKTTAALDDLPLKDPPATDTVVAKIDEIKKIVQEMDDRYDKFWKSIGPFRPYNKDDPHSDLEGNPDNLDSIFSMKSKEQCSEWNDKVCQHVEMDLIERLQRIASRKLVMLKEDYDSTGYNHFTPGTCLPSDDNCLLLHPEEKGQDDQWEIKAPVYLANPSDDAREQVRQATLRQPIGFISAPQFLPYNTSIHSLLPFFDWKKPFVLSPVPH